MDLFHITLLAVFLVIPLVVVFAKHIQHEARRGGLPKEVTDGFLGADSTPLMKAAFDGDPSGVTSVLQSGADVNTKTQEGMTALMFAVMSSDRDTVGVLLEAGADVNERTKNGDTALHAAASSRSGNSAEIVGLLLKAGADASAKNDEGHGVLMAATLVEESLPWYFKLISLDLNPTAWPRRRRNRQEIVELLRKAGAEEADELRTST